MRGAEKQLILRNIKLYFKDRSTFLMSMITPMVLFVLFISFLGSVYTDSFRSLIPKGMEVSDQLVNAFTINWLLSSIIAVSSVTVAFCSNIIMVQDRLNGCAQDLLVAPLKKSALAVSYFIGNFLTTLIICYTVTAVGFLYSAVIGWYFSPTDVLLILGDVLLCVWFGTSFAALADYFIHSQGGVGAVSTLVSALYGFLCGAYMPISQFSPVIRRFVMCMPGTYGTGLLRGHYAAGVLRELNKTLPDALISGIRDGFDANLYVGEYKVETWLMYTVIAGSAALFLGAYVIANVVCHRKTDKK